MEISNDYKRQLRAIGHKLKAIITVAENGLNANIEQEIDRALEDHELIKIRINIPDRQQRRDLSEAICATHNAQLVQRIGNVSLLFRAARKPQPRLSNLLRAV